MSVAVSGLSGLTNAYRSVMSADGSNAMAGASRWLDAATGAPIALSAMSPVAPAQRILRDVDMGGLPPASREGRVAPRGDGASWPDTS